VDRLVAVAGVLVDRLAMVETTIRRVTRRSTRTPPVVVDAAVGDGLAFTAGTSDVDEQTQEVRTVAARKAPMATALVRVEERNMPSSSAHQDVVVVDVVAAEEVAAARAVMARKMERK
jgi:hypothetical protein